MKLAADYFPRGHFETWAVCQTLFPHVKPRLERKLSEESPLRDWADLPLTVSWYIQQIGDFTQVEILAKAAVKVKVSILRLDHPETLVSMTSPALACSSQGRWEEHPDTLIAMGNLVLMIHKQGRLEEAEKLEALVYVKRSWVTAILTLSRQSKSESCGRLIVLHRRMSWIVTIASYGDVFITQIKGTGQPECI
jgi:hypothetical protein